MAISPPPCFLGLRLTFERSPARRCIGNTDYVPGKFLFPFQSVFRLENWILRAKDKVFRLYFHDMRFLSEKKFSRHVGAFSDTDSLGLKSL